MYVVENRLAGNNRRTVFTLLIHCLTSRTFDLPWLGGDLGQQFVAPPAPHVLVSAASPFTIGVAIGISQDRAFIT